MATTKLDVDGMSCEGCETVVQSSLSDVSGVESVDVDREAGLAVVEGDAATGSLVEAVDFAGYEAEPHEDDGE